MKLITKIFAVVGVLLLLTISIIAINAFNAVKNFDTPEARQKRIIERTRDEQKEVGISCKEYPSQLKDFLNGNIHPIIEMRNAGEEWGKWTSNELIQKIDYHEKALLTCVHLYRLGENGTLNDLQNLPYEESIFKKFTLMTTMLRHPTSLSSRCNQECLDSTFSDIENNYIRLHEKLNKANNRE